ncbi:uncharacterized protein TNCV_4781761 [Trichonephila clavipes]|nr:uncharacterized protein TNCV_4781761 [Trichonephila clavipes]
MVILALILVTTARWRYQREYSYRFLLAGERKPQESVLPSSRKSSREVGGVELILTSHCSATRGLLATDHVILNHGQVTWTTPELAPPLLTTTPHQREDVSALDRFNVHRCPTRRVFSGTGIELMTCLPWLDTLTTGLPQPCEVGGRKGGGKGGRPLTTPRVFSL